MKPDNLSQYAAKELKLIGLLGHDNSKKNEFGNRILSIVGKFREYNISISQTFQMLNVLQRVTRFLPLSPLTGNEDEWIAVTHPKIFGVTHQNVRFFNLFKHSFGVAFQSDGYKVIRPNGDFYFAIKEISFPYIPSWETITEEQYQALTAKVKTLEHEIELQNEKVINPNTDTPEVK